MGSIIQMYSSAVPGDALASIDCPMNGKLIAVEWSIRTASAGADFTQAAQLSFASVSQFVSNDARAVISNCVTAQEFTTSGVINESVNKYVSLPDIDVGMGERIWLHSTGTAVSMAIRALLHFSFNMDLPRSRMR